MSKVLAKCRALPSFHGIWLALFVGARVSDRFRREFTWESKMKSVVLFGAILAVLGLVAFAIPSFNTEKTQDVVKFGDLKVQAKTEEPHFIPPMVSGGAMVLGVLLIGAGMVMSRQ
jgi:hypothetical protein